jgi:hypothetical protein
MRGETFDAWKSSQFPVGMPLAQGSVIPRERPWRGVNEF